VITQDSATANHIAITGGLLGLVPFWGLASAKLWLTGVLLVSAPLYLVNYAALILTFIGAIWWGIALSLPENALSQARRNFLFAWSLVPCLLAWLFLGFNTQLALISLAVLLGLQLLMDFAVLRRSGLMPRWFWHLRIVLSLGAVPALVFAAVNFSLA
jgi:hypothetical protein